MPDATSQPRCFAVVPAAGSGTRMSAAKPKQYLPLGSGLVIEQTLARLLEVSRLQTIVVAIAPGDPFWPELAIANHPKLVTVAGGAERMHSVLNGIEALAGIADDNDWVLVHDVARPCVEAQAIEQMIEQLQHHPVGGIMALPVSDTVKEVAGDEIIATHDRTTIWRAQTPQMFRVGLLREALQRGIDSQLPITDEASALEWAGYRPRVVEGAATNIKITRPEDLALAAYYLSQSAANPAGNPEGDEP